MEQSDSGILLVDRFGGEIGIRYPLMQTSIKRKCEPVGVFSFSPPVTLRYLVSLNIH